MAVRVNKVDIKSVMCPAVNGVRSEAKAVRIYNGSTWVDVWASMKIMRLTGNTITRGMLAINSAEGIQYAKSMASGTGSMAGGGTLVFSVDGEWVNPTVSFYYEGAMMYEASTGTYNNMSAGSIAVYHRIKGASNAGTTVVLSKVGVEGVNNFDLDCGTVSKTLSGTYDRLGLSITVPTYTSNYNFASLSIVINSVTIGTQRAGFDRADGFDYF